MLLTLTAVSSKVLYKQEGEIPLVWKARCNSHCSNLVVEHPEDLQRDQSQNSFKHIDTESNFLVTVWMQQPPDCSTYYYAPVQNNSHRDTRVLPRV